MWPGDGGLPSPADGHRVWAEGSLPPGCGGAEHAVDPDEAHLHRTHGQPEPAIVLVAHSWDNR